MVSPVIKNNIERIGELCKKNRVLKLYAFGSVCTTGFSPLSDIDLIVDFKENLEPIEQGEAWWNLFYEFKDLFHREIDLLVGKSLKNPYLIKEINKTKELLYGGQG